MQYVAVGFLQLSLSLSTNYTLLGFAPFKNGYSEYPFLELTIYHIEAHQAWPAFVSNTLSMRFNMVGSQGVEPRCPLGRLIYSQVQSPVLLATHVLHTTKQV